MQAGQVTCRSHTQCKRYLLGNHYNNRLEEKEDEKFFLREDFKPEREKSQGNQATLFLSPIVAT